MTKNIVAFGILACIIVLQTGCVLDSLKDVPAPCGDPLDYYNVLPDQTGNKLSTTETSNLPVKSETEACFKLREAIRLSMPGNKQQNDKEALVLLKDLKRSGELSESDLRFNNMLLQYVSQRQGSMLDSLKDLPAPCGDPLDYYNVLPDQTGNKLSTTETSNLPVKSETEVCFKLREAIRLSMPGNKQQSDKEALVLLKDLKRSGELSESDLRFNNMLLQHVSQRQNLRKMIGAQEKRLKKVERQLDQLKNIEAEIDKKERSITSPIDE